MELSDDVSETVTGIEPSWNLQFFDGSVLTDDSVAALVIFVIPAAFDDPFGQKNDTVELKVTLLTEYETLTFDVCHGAIETVTLRKLGCKADARPDCSRPVESAKDLPICGKTNSSSSGSKNSIH